MPLRLFLNHSAFDLPAGTSKCLESLVSAAFLQFSGFFVWITRSLWIPALPACFKDQRRCDFLKLPLPHEHRSKLRTTFFWLSLSICRRAASITVAKWSVLSWRAAHLAEKSASWRFFPFTFSVSECLRFGWAPFERRARWYACVCACVFLLFSSKIVCVSDITAFLTLVDEKLAPLLVILMM